MAVAPSTCAAFTSAFWRSKARTAAWSPDMAASATGLRDAANAAGPASNGSNRAKRETRILTNHSSPAQTMGSPPEYGAGAPAITSGDNGGVRPRLGPGGRAAVLPAAVLLTTAT